MKPEDIQLTDYMRILLGEVPWSFLIEVVLRIFIIYLVLMISMRLMGKRMASMLSNSEMAALVSLAAAIGVPMLAPDRGMLPVVIIALIVVSIQRLISYYASKDAAIESTVLGDLSVLVKDGQMLLDVMEKNRIPRERLLAEFRNTGVRNLGMIRRAYFEAGGNFTHMQYDEPRPGLSIIPKWDQEFREEQQVAEGVYACNSCGNLVNDQTSTEANCTICGHQEWSQAVLT